ncbi:esterase-like activity of phytase family protein [Halotalea alkalilenta]|uniref:esterase-like activity of phytase family protein n=1 Tax=Halotalea alkalilenta TaxID=376489 RepID=UPI0004825B50|nr:esterase-like activity of phytase family protein [Halotalea alkalilenta]
MRALALYHLIVALGLAACAPTGPFMLGGPEGGGNAAGVGLCGTLKLPGRMPDGTALGGISALAYDATDDVLYMLADRARVFTARPVFDDARLVRLELLESFALLDAHGEQLRMPKSDSESMALSIAADGTKTLLVGFERDHRIQRFSLAPKRLGMPLDDPIRPEGARSARNNGSLEAMTIHPRLGVIAGLEFSPRDLPRGETRLFDLHGNEWRYRLAEAAGSGLTAMAPLDDGLLTLERAFKPFHPLVISLRKVTLEANGEAHVETLARFASDQGWRLDNFEGLTLIGDHRYLMASDNNYLPIQSSLLSCVEVPVASAQR